MLKRIAEDFFSAAVIFTFFALGSVLAAETPPAGKTPIAESTEMIVVSKAVELANALAEITGTHDEVVGKGDNVKVIPTYYDLSGDTIWACTDNIAALNKVIQTAQETQKKLIAKAEQKNGGPLKSAKDAVRDANGNIIAQAEPSPEQIALNEELQKVMDSEHPVAKLFHIKRADLNVGKNHYRGMTLKALLPILDP